MVLGMRKTVNATGVAAAHHFPATHKLQLISVRKRQHEQVFARDP
jgi:hypothetical protein